MTCVYGSPVILASLFSFSSLHPSSPARLRDVGLMGIGGNHLVHLRPLPFFQALMHLLLISVYGRFFEMSHPSPGFGSLLCY